ncbi:MAG: mycothiol system anti-sigma-R factor [Micromonosporaceae bacterium]
MGCGDPHDVDCRDVLQEVYLYLDLECDTDRRDRIRGHLDECSPCLREYGLEQEIKALVARCCSQEVAPESLKQRVRAKLQQIVIEADAREFLAE